jgi:hypothetical protein
VCVCVYVQKQAKDLSPSMSSNGGIPSQQLGPAVAGRALQLLVDPSGLVDRTSLKRSPSAVSESNEITTRPASAVTLASTGPVHSDVSLQSPGGVGHTTAFGMRPCWANAACTVCKARRLEISFLLGGWSQPQADLPPQSSATATPLMSVSPPGCGAARASASRICMRPVPISACGGRGSGGGSGGRGVNVCSCGKMMV